MCYYPIQLHEKVNENTGEYREKMVVPCGRCIECVQKKRSGWTLRILSESIHHEVKYFVTLTYNDKHLPKNGKLQKKDLQKFLKRLRHKEKNKVVYFAVGEYGSQTKRPHYHLIIMGASSDNIIDSWKDSDKQAIGFSRFDPVNIATIHYVTGYMIDKEQFDKYGLPVKDEKSDRFQVSSKGLGKSYVEMAKKKHLSSLSTETELFQFKGHIPRYLKLKIFNELQLNTLNQKQKEQFQKSLNIKKAKTSRKYHQLMLEQQKRKKL